MLDSSGAIRRHDLPRVLHLAATGARLVLLCQRFWAAVSRSFRPLSQRRAGCAIEKMQCARDIASDGIPRRFFLPNDWTSRPHSSQNAAGELTNPTRLRATGAQGPLLTRRPAQSSFGR